MTPEEQTPLTFQQKLAAIRNGNAPKTTGKKPPKPISKVSKKKQKEMADAKDEQGDTELVRFYRACMKRMTGYCLNCSTRTETHVYSGAIFSICHILDKRETMCPSVRDHPCNWVELCPDCHREFDTPPFEKDKTIWDKREEMGFWEVVRGKLCMVYQNLAEDERRHFPERVLIWMNDNEPFK